MTKYNYFLRSLQDFNTTKNCPYCKSGSSTVIDRKYIFTTLNECSQCKLFFRHPLDTTEFNKKFYQKGYEQNDGITTDLPSEAELKSMMETNFVGSTKDYSSKIAILKSLKSNYPIKIIDYGSNWGYTSYQFIQTGFQVQAYDISIPRATFGKKLGLNILTDESKLAGDVDIFFNAHVIEHLPDIKKMFLLAKSLINNDGYFVSFCPNGSEEFKVAHPESFHRLWGQVHPNYLNAEFFSTVFKDVPYLIGCDLSKQEDIEDWDGSSQKILNLSGSELFVIAKIKGQTF